MRAFAKITIGPMIVERTALCDNVRKINQLKFPNIYHLLLLFATTMNKITLNNTNHFTDITDQLNLDITINSVTNDI